MQPEFVEVFCHLRDFGKPVSQQDAADYAKIRAPHPPSRSLLKRVKRAQLGMTPRSDKPAREYAPKSAEVLASERQREFYKKIISDLGGSLTIAPSGPVEREPVQYFEQNGPIEQRSEREKLHEEARRLQREQIRAMGKMLCSDYQPDMFTVLDAYGSFEAYCSERKAG